MPQTNLLANPNPVTNSSDKVVTIACWDNNIESHLITKIYKSTEEVALWFPEFFSSSAETEAITIYQIIVWIKETLEILEQGKSVRIKPYGSSMRGIIKSGQLIELVPSEFEKVKVDDVILVKLQDNCLLNKVIEIEQNKLLIGNKRLKTQKWVKKESVVAKVAQVFN